MNIYEKHEIEIVKDNISQQEKIKEEIEEKQKQEHNPIQIEILTREINRIDQYIAEMKEKFNHSKERGSENELHQKNVMHCIKFDSGFGSNTDYIGTRSIEGHSYD